VDVFQHEEAVYGLSNDPNNEHIFASACDDGRVLVYDTREPATSGAVATVKSVLSGHPGAKK
jgi:WD repeat-containing protein 22